MGKIITENRPWGSFERFTVNEKSTVKLVYVKAGKRLSYQYHNKRAEFWKVVCGQVIVTINGKKKTLFKGDMINVPLRAKHRIEAVKNSVILEIAKGAFSEADIVRLQDDYARV